MAGPVTSPRSICNLPADLTSFIGRRSERAHIKRLISQTRLVTLTGFGGVGKTRLCLHVALELRRAFRHGVVFVDLVSVTDPALIPDAITTAIGLYTQAAGTTTDSLISQLTSRDILLLIDNCEHVIDGCAQLIGELLRACPSVHVLATSREPLGITGEAVLRVAPLSFPPAGARVAGKLTEYEAVTLFVDRAHAAVSGFGITDENRKQVAEICRQLDGIPLALELAAVRLRGLTPAQLLDRLTDRFRLLDAGSRSAPDRQRTLLACIEWSFDLCTPAEQDLWARASVFSAGFELDAAEAICGHDGRDVLPTLLSLVDKSIVISEDVGGRMRYRMLEVIRQFGEQRLRQAGDEHALRARHRDFFAALADRSEQEWTSTHQHDWINRLRRDHPNLQAALAFCLIQPDDAEIGLRIAAGLRDHWINLGALSEGNRWLTTLLERGPVTARTRAWALRTAAWTALLYGNLDYAEQCIKEGFDLGGDLDDGTFAMFDNLSSMYRVFVGDFTGAISAGVAALTVARATSDRSLQITCLICLQIAHHAAGDFERSLEYHSEYLQIAEQFGDRWYLCYSLWNAGLAHWAREDIGAAVSALCRSLRIEREMANELGIAAGLESLAWVTTSVDPQRGAVLLGAATARWDFLGMSVSSIPLLARHHAECNTELGIRLGPQRLAAAVARGLRLSFHEALDLALGGADDESSSGAVTINRPVPASTRSPLTRREQEVAELVSRGLSNREIAQTLVIAQRTAETHVERILTKLGFTSRTQIAAWLTDRDLAT